jgi:hypothetical protein
VTISKLETQAVERPSAAPGSAVTNVVERWSAAWRAAGSPPLGSFLDRVPAADRAAVLPALLTLEWSDPNRRGSPPLLNDYLHAFPSTAT